ncbi:hypothetical protein PsorP6_018015 [Peronosclerospora sorghi]|uniref:Uncharacterized protein n=1 Tax=Peronosclerospora sorghi TaxID=230839 RepID=A0ACC0WG25_9STRA|nr:hypothetical protein PsorP6_018015 [Peronosclerospora sorghi]
MVHRLAQLVALGDFPSWIHPFVFSWPSGSVLAYFQAKAVGSESARTSHDFVECLQSLPDAGYTKVNLIAHSVGARVFFSALKRGVLDHVFLVRGSGSTRPPHTLKLAMFTLCHPDDERTDFVQRGGGYDRARRFCTHVTLYADRMDGATAVPSRPSATRVPDTSRSSGVMWPSSGAWPCDRRASRPSCRVASPRQPCGPMNVPKAMSRKDRILRSV